MGQAVPQDTACAREVPAEEIASPLALRVGRINAWVFDLDNTLYEPETEIFDAVRDRMTDFIRRACRVSGGEAARIRERYYRQYGATLRGLVTEYHISPEEYLGCVHAVSLETLKPKPELAALLKRLPGRCFVFTNASRAHAERVLDKLELRDSMHAIFDITDAALNPKPQAESYRAFLAATGIDPERAAFFEDSQINLPPAAALGMTTVLVRAKRDAQGDACAPQASECHHTTYNLAACLAGFAAVGRATA